MFLGLEYSRQGSKWFIKKSELFIADFRLKLLKANMNIKQMPITQNISEMLTLLKISDIIFNINKLTSKNVCNPKYEISRHPTCSETN